MDGGGDVSAKNRKVVGKWELFFRKHDLDMLVITNSPPGMSKINFVERGMCPQSKALVGHRIPLDGPKETPHLRSGKVIDEEKCKENMDYGGKYAANIFQGRQYGDYRIAAHYVPREEDEKFIEVFDNYKLDLKYSSKHLTIGSLIAIFHKCLPDTGCAECGDWRSPLLDKLSTNTLPFPVLSKRDPITKALNTYIYQDDDDMKQIHSGDLVSQNFRYDPLALAILSNKYLLRQQ